MLTWGKEMLPLALGTLFTLGTMKLDYTPVHVQTGQPLTPERMNELICEWPGYGIIYGTQTADAPDPANNNRDMAILLCQHGFSLSEELVGLLPKPNDIPQDAVA